MNSWTSQNRACARLCSIASVIFDSLWPHGLQPTRLLRPWDSPGENPEMSSHAFLQGIFLTQGLDPCLLYLGGFFIIEPPGKPQNIAYREKIIIVNTEHLQHIPLEVGQGNFPLSCSWVLVICIQRIHVICILVILIICITSSCNTNNAFS